MYLGFTGFYPSHPALEATLSTCGIDGRSITRLGPKRAAVSDMTAASRRMWGPRWTSQPKQDRPLSWHTRALLPLH